MQDKKSFVMYSDYGTYIEMLSDAECGQLFKAVFAYSNSESVPELDGAVKMAFLVIQNQLDRDLEKYKLVVERRREAGKKGGRPKKAKKANGFSEKQTKAKKADNVNVNENDNDNDNVNDNVSVNENDNDILSSFVDTTLSTPENKKLKRHKYGEYNNVLLSDDDLEKLKDEFPLNYLERIENLSEYIASSGKSYKNHLATIRKWSKNEREHQSSSVISNNPYLDLLKGGMLDDTGRNCSNFNNT